MGMQKDDTNPYDGTTVTDAYHRVTSIRTGDPRVAGTMINVGTFLTKAASDAGHQPLLERRYSNIDLETSAMDTNTLADAYAKVKAVTDQHDAFFNTGVTDVDPDA